jgi:histidyl-tRNA synthetase
VTRKAALTISAEPPRGMRDILPDEAELRDATAQTILAVYRRYGFRRVETPALENIQLLTQGEGGENEKLIFKVLKRGEKLDLARASAESDLVDLGLRFDLTVPLARYYAHNHAQLAKPLKAVQIGPVWRAERPQKGRYRQFTQCDIDILGVRSAVAEIELILATTEALRELGLRDLTVRINDRRILIGMVRACGFAPDRYDSVFITLDKMDKVDRAALIKELENAGHPASAIAKLMSLLVRVQRIPGSNQTLDELRGLLAEHAHPEAFAALTTIVRTTSVEAGGHWQITFDPALVRGMSYYTGPIFEIGSSAFPSSIAGGGRYDEMIGKILGEPVPATGFSIGFERVVSILTASAEGRARREPRIALMFDEEVDALPAVLSAARRLRAEGLAVSVEGRGKRLGAQLTALESHGFAGFAIFDGTERPELRWFGDRERSREVREST